MGNESKSSFEDGDGDSDENEENRKLLSSHKTSEKQNRITFGPTQSFRVKSDRDFNEKVNIYELLKGLAMCHVQNVQILPFLIAHEVTNMS